MTPRRHVQTYQHVFTVVPEYTMTPLARRSLILACEGFLSRRFDFPFKCQGGDSNPYGFLHQILSLARLPIPPPRQGIFDCRFSIYDCKERRSQCATNTLVCVYEPVGALPAGDGEGCAVAAAFAAAAFAAASAAAFFFASAAATASARFLSTAVASTG